MQTDNSKLSAGANDESELKAEATTSSSNGTKPLVVGSQSQEMYLESMGQLIKSAFEKNVLILDI